MFESKGYKRTIGVLAFLLANLADTLPVLAPYKEMLLVVGNFFGATGLLHATLDSMVGKK